MENSSCFLDEEFSFSSYLGLVNDTTNLLFHQALLISSYMIYMRSNVNDATSNNNNNNNNNNKVFDQLEYFCPFTDLPPQSYLRYAVMGVDFAVPPGNWGM